MSTSINDLPPEVIVKIFNKIDERSLKCAILVCTRWKDLIQSVCGLTITIDCLDRDFYAAVENAAGLNFMMRDNVQINKIKIVDLIGNTVRIVADIFERHAASIVKLTLFDCFFHELHVFMDLMNLLPNLKELILNRTICFDKTIEESDCDTLKTTKLKSLQFTSSSDCLLNCFKMLELNSIKIEGDVREMTLTDLVRHQQHLKRLSLDVFTTYEFLNDDMPFQLTHLSLQNVESTSTLLPFLRTQNHIEALALEPLGGVQFVWDVSYSTVNIFPNLKSLRLDICDLHNLFGQKSTNNLILVDKRKHNYIWPTSFTSISFSCNITDVTLYNIFTDNNSIELLANNFINITKLSVSMFTDTVKFDGAQFRNLKCLNVKIFNVRSLKKWKEFINDNSTITELSIESYGDPENVNVFLQTTTEILKLHVLRIGNIIVDECFFDIIRRNCPALSTLDLLRCNCLVEYNELNDISGLQFHYDNFNFRLNDLESWYER